MPIVKPKPDNKLAANKATKPEKPKISDVKVDVTIKSLRYDFTVIITLEENVKKRFGHSDTLSFTGIKQGIEKN